MPTHDCSDCPMTERRVFLRDATAWLAAAALVRLPIRFGRAIAVKGTTHAYPIPDIDGATIDHDNQVILVRFQGKGFAFNLSCPHQNTALRWHPEDGQFQCPKHHSRYTPDGVFISGRATRSMDRFAVQRDGMNILVDLDRLYRQDQDAANWDTAFITT